MGGPEVPTSFSRTIAGQKGPAKVLPVKIPVLPPSTSAPPPPGSGPALRPPTAGRGPATSSLTLGAKVPPPPAATFRSAASPPSRFTAGGAGSALAVRPSAFQPSTLAAKPAPKPLGALSFQPSKVSPLSLKTPAPGIGNVPPPKIIFGGPATTPRVVAGGFAAAQGRTAATFSRSLASSKALDTVDADVQRAAGSVGPASQPAWLSVSARGALKGLDTRTQWKVAHLANRIGQGSRQDLESLLSSGKLTQADAKGNTVLDFLYTASQAELAQAAKMGGLTSPELASRLVSNLARPNDIRQCGTDDCVWANVTRDLAASAPVDYVRLNLGLYTKGFSSLPGSQQSVQLPSPVSGLIASSAKVDGTPLGALKGLFPGRNDYALSSQGERRTALQAIAVATARQTDVPVVMSNPDGSAHMVTVSQINGDRMKFYDPLAPAEGGEMSVQEFLLAAKAVFVPADLPLPLKGIDPDDRTGVGKGRTAVRRVLG